MSKKRIETAKLPESVAPAAMNPEHIEGSKAWWERRGLDAGVGVWSQMIPFSEYVKSIHAAMERGGAPAPTASRIQTPENLGVEIPKSAYRDKKPVEAPKPPQEASKGGLAWAYSLKARAERGEGLNPNQIRCYKNALGEWPGGERR